MGGEPLGVVAVLAGLGFLMLAAEVFVPGMVLGVLGMILLAGAVVYGYATMGVGEGSLVLVVVLSVTLAGFLGWLRLFPATPVGRRIMLTRKLERGEGAGGGAADGLVGEEGEALSALRPSGVALILGRRVDVVSESRFIEPGERVVVVAQRDLKVVVRPLDGRGEREAGEAERF